jgi:D-alanyl-D-alanine carboxypeptidase
VNRSRRRRSALRALLPLLATAGLLAGCASAAHPATTAAALGHTPATVAPTAPPAPPPFDMHAHSTTDPTSEWVIVNKRHPLVPIDYAPGDLVDPAMQNVNGQPVRAVMVPALTAMLAAARSGAGLQFQLQSGYRGYATQLAVYRRNVAAYGRASAEADTARPGFSEHQTGLAVDLSALPAKCSLDACFAGTAQGKWLAANAWRYGFLLRYPADKEQVTGYTFEPWHYRFIGTDLAAEMHRRGAETLEEFFGVTGGPSY